MSAPAAWSWPVGCALALLPAAGAQEAPLATHERQVSALLAQLAAEGLGAGPELLPAQAPARAGADPLLGVLAAWEEAVPWDQRALLQNEVRAAIGALADPAPPRSAEQVTAARRAVEGLLPALEQALEPAAGFAWDEWGGFATPSLKHHPRVESLHLGLVDLARGDLGAGRAALGWTRLLLGLRLLERLTLPLHVEQRWRARCEANAVRALAVAASTARPPEGLAVEVQAALRRLEAALPLSLVLRGELAAGLSRYSLEGDEGLKRAVQDERPGAAVGPREQGLAARWRFARLLGDTARASSLPAAELQARVRELCVAYREEAGDEALTPVHVEGAWRCAQERRARLALAWSLLEALERPLPDTPPAWLPEDPFAPGSPLGWRREGPRAVLLWSVGADGKDQGGRTLGAGTDGAPGSDLVLPLTLPPG